MRTARRVRRRSERSWGFTFAKAQGAYDEACSVAFFIEMKDPRLRGRVICERCGLEQPYLSADDFAAEAELDLYPCEGWDDIGCGSEVGITHEGYADAA